MEVRSTAMKAGTLAVTALVIGGAVAYLTRPDNGYRVRLVFASSSDLLSGENVDVSGIPVGKVVSLKPQDGQAVVTVSLKGSQAPLHDGSTAAIEWKAVLGERVVEITPGPAKNAVIPSGSMVQGNADRVEIDQVLAALDPTTRTHLASLVQQLDSVVNGHETDINSSLKTVAPMLTSLGSLLQGVGTDGAALKDLVTRTSQLMGTLSDQNNKLSGTVSNLTTQQAAMVTQSQALTADLQKLPATLDITTKTLNAVPKTVADSKTLLSNVATATSKLPAVTQQLTPLLSDLQPTLTSLHPTIASLSVLLGQTPDLLSSATGLLPSINDDLTRVDPALNFFRPYTPEAIGFLSNWGDAGAPIDSLGHFGHIKGQEGTTSVIGTPVLPPGVTDDEARQPGQNANQTWTDAEGQAIH